MKKEGCWVAFEGLDKAGKTTLAEKLTYTLPNAVYQKGICSPTWIGRIVRCFPTTWLFIIELFYTAYQIKKLRKKGLVVLNDRYFASVACHEPLTLQFPNNIFIQLADRLLPKPDRLVYITVEKGERLERIIKSRNGNKHERWLVKNPEWIDKRENGYKKYFDSFLGKKLMINTSSETTQQSLLKLKLFMAM